MMKAKFIRDMEVAEGVTPEEWVSTNSEGKRFIPAGTEFEHPEAFWQVLFGNATPVDDECKVEVDRRASKPQLEEARQASDELYEKVADGQSLEDDEDDEGDDE
jgi:hypothetical protein